MAGNDATKTRTSPSSLSPGDCVAIQQNCHSGRSPVSLPRTGYGVGRDPWFDRLTTLSEVEGESRKLAENQIILDLPPPLAGDDELRRSLLMGRRGLELAPYPCFHRDRLDTGVKGDWAW